MRKKARIHSELLCWLWTCVGLSLAACDPCLRWENHVYGGFYDLAVEGQTLYPARPADEDYGGYTFDEGAEGWESQLAMVKSPSNIPGVSWGVMTIDILPPYCEEGALAKYCAHVYMDQFIAGPKKDGEVYQVQHHLWRNHGLPPAEPPGIFLGWEESGWGLPDYQSVSVTGTATVLSESPFQLDYDVVFLDEAGNRREVTVWFEPRLSASCVGD